MRALTRWTCFRNNEKSITNQITHHHFLRPEKSFNASPQQMSAQANKHTNMHVAYLHLARDVRKTRITLACCFKPHTYTKKPHLAVVLVVCQTIVLEKSRHVSCVFSKTDRNLLLWLLLMLQRPTGRATDEIDAAAWKRRARARTTDAPEKNSWSHTKPETARQSRTTAATW